MRPHVMVIGLGTAGLSIAKLLSKANLDVTVIGHKASNDHVLALNSITCNILSDIWSEEYPSFHKDSYFIPTRNVKWGTDTKFINLDQPSFILSSNNLEKKLTELLKKENVKIIIYDFDEWNLKDIFDIAKDTDYVIDASGRPSFISQRMGKSHKLELGQRCVIFSRVELNNFEGYSSTWMESTKYGWVFLVPHKKKLSLLQIMVADPSNHELAQKSMDVVNASLMLKNHISPQSLHDIHFFKAFPQITLPLIGKKWLSVGDAAASFDPLSGDGTGHALRGAILASAVIKAILLNRYEARDCINFYSMKIQRAFQNHIASCIEYYNSMTALKEWKSEINLMQDYIVSANAQPIPDGMCRHEFKLVGFDIVAQCH